MVTAGWSKVDGPVAVLLANHDHHPGVAAWTPVEPAGLDMPPVPGATLDTPILDVLEAQRLVTDDAMWMLQPCSTVGCFAETTTVTAHCIETVRICEWPDEIGEQLNTTQQRLVA